MQMNDAWAYANERHPVASWSCWFVIHIPVTPPPPPPLPLSLPPLSGPLSCFRRCGRRGAAWVRAWTYRMCFGVPIPQLSFTPTEYFNWQGKLCSCSHKLKVAIAMQICIQHAFVVCFFQAPHLSSAHLQKPAVAYPKGRRAFNSIMCGKRQQLYTLPFQHG